MKRVKVVNGHSGMARFCAELGKCVGYVARCQVEDIPSPYAYSPVKPVYLWDGKKVITFETKHLRHEVFDVEDLLIFRTQREAENWHIKYRG